MCRLYFCIVLSLVPRSLIYKTPTPLPAPIVFSPRLLGIDSGVVVRTRCDESAQAVAGHAHFTSAEQAQHACSRLNGSLLGSRQITANIAPVETESLALQNLVIVRVTGVAHKGYANFDCGTEANLQLVLTKVGVPPAYTSGAVRWGFSNFGGVNLGFRRYATRRPRDKSQPTWLVVKNVPQDWTPRRLVQAMSTLGVAFPSHSAMPFQRDYRLLEEEEKRLHQKGGLSFQRKRIKWLTKIAGEGLDAGSFVGFLHRA